MINLRAMFLLSLFMSLLLSSIAGANQRVLVTSDNEGSIWEDRTFHRVRERLDPRRFLVTETWADEDADGCRELTCLRRVAERHAIDYIVGVSVRPLGQSGFRLRAWLFDRDSPKVFRREAGRDCSDCGRAEALHSLETLVDGLFDPGDEPLPSLSPHRPFFAEFCGYPDCINSIRGRKIIVLPVQMSGTNDLEFDLKVQTLVRSTRNLLLRQRDLPRSVRRCHERACLDKLAARYRISLVLGGEVKRTSSPGTGGEAYELRVWLFDADHHTLRESTGSCDGCVDFDAEERLAQLAGHVLGDEDSPGVKYETPNISTDALTSREPSTSFPCARDTRVFVGTSMLGWFDRHRGWSQMFRYTLKSALDARGFATATEPPYPDYGTCLDEEQCQALAHHKHVDWTVQALVVNDELLPPNYHFILRVFDGALLFNVREDCWNCSLHQVQFRLKRALSAMLESLPFEYPTERRNGGDCQPIYPIKSESAATR